MSGEADDLPADIESPFLHFTRDEWAQLRADTQLTLTIDDLRKLQSTHDPISLDEVIAIYLPLSRLLALYVAATQGLFKATQRFLGADDGKVPYIIGVAGSVAVGKSTTARVLQALLTRWPNTPKVQLITTDGFLHPNAELTRQGLMERKGFPESYDGTALIRFLVGGQGGQAQCRRAGLFASRLRRRAGRDDRRRPAGHSHRRGAQRAAAQPPVARRQGDPLRLGFLRLLGLPRRRRRAPGEMVRRALHAAARDGVPRPAQLFPQIRRPRRRRGGGDRALDLAAHQSGQPAREHSADPSAREPSV